MSEFDKLKRTLFEFGKMNQKVSIVRCEVEAVDWNKKTMTVRSLVDGLEYFNVLLGLGYVQQKPKVNTKCIVGLYDGSVGGFLLEADEVEEALYTINETQLTIKDEGFVLKKANDDLKTVLNDLIDEINKIIVVNGTSINVAATTDIKQRLNSILTT